MKKHMRLAAKAINRLADPGDDDEEEVSDEDTNVVNEGLGITED